MRAIHRSIRKAWEYYRGRFQRPLKFEGWVAAETFVVWCPDYEHDPGHAELPDHHAALPLVTKLISKVPDLREIAIAGEQTYTVMEFRRDDAGQRHEVPVQRRCRNFHLWLTDDEGKPDVFWKELARPLGVLLRYLRPAVIGVPDRADAPVYALNSEGRLVGIFMPLNASCEGLWEVPSA
jgi:hypothetical protein